MAYLGGCDLAAFCIKAVQIFDASEKLSAFLLQHFDAGFKRLLVCLLLFEGIFMSQMPVVFLPHGGGPMPLLGDANHRELIAFLKKLPEQLPKPKAILVVTAHWEAPVVSVSSAQHPGMLYDYYGF